MKSLEEQVLSFTNHLLSCHDLKADFWTHSSKIDSLVLISDMNRFLQLTETKPLHLSTKCRTQATTFSNFLHGENFEAKSVKKLSLAKVL